MKEPIDYDELSNHLINRLGILSAIALLLIAAGYGIYTMIQWVF